MTGSVNVNKLKGKMVERGLSIGDLADKIGVDRSTLYRKINGGCESLLIREANGIVQALDMNSSEAMAIFFNHPVA